MDKVIIMRQNFMAYTSKPNRVGGKVAKHNRMKQAIVSVIILHLLNK